MLWALYHWVTGHLDTSTGLDQEGVLGANDRPDQVIRDLWGVEGGGRHLREQVSPVLFLCFSQHFVCSSSRGICVELFVVPGDNFLPSTLVHSEVCFPPNFQCALTVFLAVRLVQNR